MRSRIQDAGTAYRMRGSENFQNYRIPYAVPHTGCGHRIQYAVTAYCMRRRISDAAAAYSMRRHILESELTGSISSAGSFRQFLGGAAPPKNTSVKSKGCQPFKKFLQSTKANRRQGKCGQSSQEQVRDVLCVTSHPRIGSQTQGCENEARVSSLTYSLTYLLTYLFIY